MNRRSRLRKWRLRGRRGQVAAVATILGLLLVVTFIANYLTATLPGQMSVNELNHEIQVQDQVGRLQALLEAASSADTVGAQFTQPITLGGAGQPPFAGPDSGYISPGNVSGNFTINFTASLPASVVGTGPVQDGTAGAGACAGGGNNRCASGTWFSATVNPTAADDLLVLVVTVYEEGAALTSNDVSSTGSAWTLVTGGGNTAATNFVQYVFWTIDPNTGADVVKVGGAGLTAHDGSAVVVAIMDEDSSNPINTVGVFTTAHTSTTSTASVSSPASGLVLGLVSISTADGAFPTITPGSAGTPCTATCVAIDSANGEAYGTTYAEFENTSTNQTYRASATLSVPESSGEIALSVNPEYTVEPGIPITAGSQAPGASFVVHLQNTYSPSAEVAFDQGGVVYAQPGSVPLFIDSPDVTFNGYSLTLWIPVFEGTIPVESGLGTSDVIARLVSSDTFVFPNSGLTLLLGSQVTVSMTSPYWAAWVGFFESLPGLSGDVSCNYLSGATCPAATAASYQPGGPVATVAVSIPATSLTLQVATFALSLT
ncbi:MAG: hypothetical protein WA547_05835 [Thermoplasmata archaeon]